MKMTYLLLTALLIGGVHAAPACCSTNLPPQAPLPDTSLYHLESQWTSDYGRTLGLGQLQGRVQVVTMFFASCAYACPVLVNDTKKIEAGLNSLGITNIGFVLVTFDTEKDTVERLHAYRKERQLDDKWVLLRGNQDDVTELAALLGVKFKRESSGQFAHSNVISILNEFGEVVHQQVGLNVDPAPSITAIQRSVGKE